MQEAALDDGRVVFCGTDSGNPSPHSSSIFLWENGVLSRAFGEGDTFDGATLTTIGGNGNCLTQSLGWNGLSGDQLVFYGAFDDGKVGFFIANLNSTLAVPVSPAVRWLLAPLMIALAVLRLRRRQPSSRLA